MTTLSRVATVFSQAFAVPAAEITRDTVPDDVPKWDSFGHMNMVSVLEKEFGLRFKPEEIMEMGSVQDILDVLAGKGVRG
jgi:acyl carrier protein